MNVNRSVEGDWSTQGVEMYACVRPKLSGRAPLWGWACFLGGHFETDALNEGSLAPSHAGLAVGRCTCEALGRNRGMDLVAAGVTGPVVTDEVVDVSSFRPLLELRYCTVHTTVVPTSQVHGPLYTHGVSCFLPILKSMTLHPNALNIPMLQRLVITRYMAGEANK